MFKGLKAEVSVPLALATAAGVGLVYQNALPPVADIAAGVEPSDNNQVAAVMQSERGALIAASILAAGVAVLAGDPAPFYVGAGFAVILSWMHRKATFAEPMAGGRIYRPNFMGERYQVESAA